MTQAEKLEALLRRAVEGGYRNDYRWKVFNGHLANEDHDYAHSYPLIFDEDFARALFGTGPNCAYCGEPPKNMHQSHCIEGSNIWPYLFEYHLQQAVISDDPISYMYKEVFGDE